MRRYERKRYRSFLLTLFFTLSKLEHKLFGCGGIFVYAVIAFGWHSLYNRGRRFGVARKKNLYLTVNQVVFGREKEGAAEVIDASDQMSKRYSLVAHCHEYLNGVSFVGSHASEKKRLATQNMLPASLCKEKN